MGVAFFILAMIAALGSFSLYRNGQKKSIISGVIKEYLDKEGGSLVAAEKSTTSGPFDDEYFDQSKRATSTTMLGYQAKETVYKKVTYTTASDNEQTAWLQLRIENLKATYVAWKKA